MLPVRDIVPARTRTMTQSASALIHAWEASPSGGRSSLHQKGQRITQIRNNHSPGKGMKALSPWKSSWVHSSPKGRFPLTELLFQGKLHMDSVRGPIYNLVALRLIIVHSHGPETSLGWGLSLAGGPTCWPRGFALPIPSTVGGRQGEKES